MCKQHQSHLFFCEPFAQYSFLRITNNPESTKSNEPATNQPFHLQKCELIANVRLADAVSGPGGQGREDVKADLILIPGSASSGKVRTEASAEIAAGP